MALTSHKVVVVVGYGGGGVSKPQKQKSAALQRPSAGATA